jgi:hypothetical protein
VSARVWARPAEIIVARPSDVPRARAWARTVEAAVNRPFDIPRARVWSRTVEVCVSRTKLASAGGIVVGYLALG